jgi:hypothetical protein
MWKSLVSGEFGVSSTGGDVLQIVLQISRSQTAEAIPRNREATDRQYEFESSFPRDVLVELVGAILIPGE